MDKNDERISVLNSQIKAYESPDDYAFGSYSDEDAEIVSPNLTLLNDLGLNVFHNGGLEKPIVSLPHIEEKIKNSSVFIPFLTPNVTVSSSSGKEIMLAGLHNDKIEILPI